MRRNAIAPIFVPQQFQREVECCSKAALMDMLWDYITRNVGDFPQDQLEEFRKTREIILTHRKNTKG